MGLVVDGEGFAKYSRIYSGKQYEAETFQQIVGELQKHHVKKYPKVVEMIGRLKEKYSRAAQLYEITVVGETGDGREVVNAVDIQWKRKELRYDEVIRGEGSYVLRTNRKISSMSRSGRPTSCLATSRRRSGI